MSVTYKISERLLDTSFSDVRAMDNYLGTLLSNCLKLIQTMVGAPHLRADATNVLTADAPDDLASLETAATDLKTQYTAHIATVAQVHVAADVTNAITADDASDLATSITLLNELRTDLVAHAALAAATGHFQADNVAGLQLGRDVANEVYHNFYLKHIGEPETSKM